MICVSDGNEPVQASLKSDRNSPGPTARSAFLPPTHAGRSAGFIRAHRLPCPVIEGIFQGAACCEARRRRRGRRPPASRSGSPADYSVGWRFLDRELRCALFQDFFNGPAW